MLKPFLKRSSKTVGVLAPYVLPPGVKPVGSVVWEVCWSQVLHLHHCIWEYRKSRRKDMTRKSMVWNKSIYPVEAFFLFLNQIPSGQKSFLYEWWRTIESSGYSVEETANAINFITKLKVTKKLQDFPRSSFNFFRIRPRLIMCSYKIHTKSLFIGQKANRSWII